MLIYFFYHDIMIPNNMFCIEYIVDFFVLEQTVGVNTRAGHIEVTADKGCHRWNRIIKLALKVVGNFGYNRCIHTVSRTAKGGIFHNHSFKRHVACALTYT